MKTAICTCIKDETLYLKEWIEWHLSVGFDHIFLYEDNGSESHIDIVKQFPDTVTLLPINIVKNEPWTEERRQRQMYYYSVRTLKDKYDWIAFIDADEFIDFEEGYDLHKLLNEYDAFPAIMLSWMLYSANGRIERPEGGVVESYPNPITDIDYVNNIFYQHCWTVKSIVNLRHNVSFCNIHVAHGAINMNGNFFPEQKVFKKAWIRHYYTKSWEEWVYRIFKRGDLCNGNRKLYEFFKVNPDLKDRRVELIKRVAHMIPYGGKNLVLLNIDDFIIAGGNIHKVEEINKKYSELKN